jgi:hypothetical protein
MTTTQALAALATIALCLFYVIRAYIEATADSAIKVAQVKTEYMPVSVATEMRPSSGRIGYNEQR